MYKYGSMDIKTLYMKDKGKPHYIWEPPQLQNFPSGREEMSIQQGKEPYVSESTEFTCSVMTLVRKSVVGVVIFSYFFLCDPADAENVLNLVNISGQYICMHFKRV